MERPRSIQVSRSNFSWLRSLFHSKFLASSSLHSISRCQSTRKTEKTIAPQLVAFKRLLMPELTSSFSLTSASQAFLASPRPKMTHLTVSGAPTHPSFLYGRGRSLIEPIEFSTTFPGHARMELSSTLMRTKKILDKRTTFMDGSQFKTTVTTISEMTPGTKMEPLLSPSENKHNILSYKEEGFNQTSQVACSVLSPQKLRTL